MSNRTYRVTEIVGTSPDGIDEAIRNAVRRASTTLRHVDWFEVTQVRGQVKDGDVEHFQVGMKIGFRLEDERRAGRRRVCRYRPVVTSVGRVSDDVPEPEPRSVLVSGGNRGIGLAIARAFLALGDSVAVTSRSGGGPEGALQLTCDVTDPAAVEQAFADVEAEHGPVEVLVANAGITADTLLLRMSEDAWDSVIQTNLTGTFRLTKRAAKGMLRLRRGRIILISSVVGMLGSAGQVNYAASKSGLVGIARSLTRELGSRSITANVVAPGFIETDMTSVLTDEQKSAIMGQVPLQRYGTVDEVAAAVTWLASPGGAYVSGAVIPVDGGLGMGH